MSDYDFRELADYMGNNREHQQECEKIMRGVDKGKVILPTASGKSRIQVSHILYDIVERIAEKSDPGVYVIAAHRLLLCSQLFTEVEKYIRETKIDVRYLLVNSDKQDLDDFMSQYSVFSEGTANILECTLSPKDIKKKYEECKSKNVPLIIVTTYHSAFKLKDAGIEISHIFNDEAHMLINNDFRKNYLKIRDICKKQFFFTATPKNSKENEEDSWGMQNKEFFGDVIYQKSAKEMIERGEMISPRLHIPTISSELVGKDKFNNHKMQIKCITESFTEHEKLIYENSFDKNKISPKIIVTCQGQKRLQEIVEDENFQQWCNRNNVTTFAISTDKGARINGVRDNSPNAKENFFKRIRNLGTHDKAIILHVDMIAEGIDIPSVTAVMSFRDIKESKLVQTIGRACRLHDNDRTRLYSGDIKATDFKKYIKPYAWVIIPVLGFDHKDFEKRVRSFVSDLREGGIPIEFYQPVVFDIGDGGEDEALNKPDSKLGGEETKVIHDIEDDSFKDDFDAIVYGNGLNNPKKMVNFLNSLKV